MNEPTEADALRALILGFRDEIEQRYTSEDDLAQHPRKLAHLIMAFFSSFEQLQAQARTRESGEV